MEVGKTEKGMCLDWQDRKEGIVGQGTCVPRKTQESRADRVSSVLVLQGLRSAASSQGRAFGRGKSSSL